MKFGSQSREDAKIIKDHICEKHSTTNLFCGMVLVTDSHIILTVNKNKANQMIGFIYSINVLIYHSVVICRTTANIVYKT